MAANLVWKSTVNLFQSSEFSDDHGHHVTKMAASWPMLAYLYFLFYRRRRGASLVFMTVEADFTVFVSCVMSERGRHMPNFSGCQKHASHVYSSMGEQNCKNLTENMVDIFLSFFSFFIFFISSFQLFIY